jgi:hypothetical protein
MKGRDDGDQSSLDQFMRTSMDPGYLDLHDRFLFELRVSPHEIPSLALEVDYDDGANWFQSPSVVMERFH